MKRLMLKLVVALLAGSSFAASFEAMGQAPYPSRPIRIISPFPAGGQTDILARTLANALTPVLGQPVIVETKIGGNGVVGAAQVAKATPDGYTLLISNAGLLTIFPTLDADLAYSPTRDFAPIIVIGGGAVVLESSAKVPVKNMAEFVALSKSKPGGLTLAGSGGASIPGLLVEQFRLQSKLPWTTVSYKGSGPKMADLISGQVEFTFDNLAASIEYIKAGQFRALAISKRSALLPDVPTFKELGYDIDDALAWHGLLAPAGTPPEVVNRLNTEISKILARPEIAKKLQEIGLEIMGGSPAHFSDFIRSENARWGKVIKDSGVKFE
ncbi:tripartite tricarboxylate transporter substrate-binding protein [soil metagenome]